MSHLEMLYKSVFSVITGYYQSRTHKEISTDDLISKPRDILIPELDRMIPEMLGTDTTRSQFLYYLRDLIATTEPWLHNTQPLLPGDFIHLHIVLTDFIFNINQLCNLSHSYTSKITLNQVDREIHGFLTGLITSSLSRMGSEIDTKILKAFSFRDSTREQIALTISQMIIDHEAQKPKPECPLQTEIDKLRQKASQSEGHISRLRNKVQSQEDEITRLLYALETQKTQHSHRLIERLIKAPSDSDRRPHFWQKSMFPGQEESGSSYTPDL